LIFPAPCGAERPGGGCFSADGQRLCGRIVRKKVVFIPPKEHISRRPDGMAARLSAKKHD